MVDKRKERTRRNEKRLTTCTCTPTENKKKEEEGKKKKKGCICGGEKGLCLSLFLGLVLIQRETHTHTHTHSLPESIDGQACHARGQPWAYQGGHRPVPWHQPEVGCGVKNGRRGRGKETALGELGGKTKTKTKMGRQAQIHDNAPHRKWGP